MTESKVHNIKAVCTGAEFCTCGGMMILSKNSGLLMCNPPKVKIYCPFCGVESYVWHPYNVEIQFKMAKD